MQVCIVIGGGINVVGIDRGRKILHGVNYQEGHPLDGLLGHNAWASAPNTLVWTFHVTFAGGRAGVEVPGCGHRVHQSCT